MLTKAGSRPYLSDPTLARYEKMYEKQGCGSGPFLAGSGSSKSQFKKPDSDPTFTSPENVEKHCFKIIFSCLYNFT